jgi:hypothetical protein
MAQVKVINGILKAEKSVVYWSVRHGKVRCLGVMVVEVNSQERLNFFKRKILTLKELS